MSNFKDSFALLSKVGACVQIRDGQEMTAMFLKIFKDDALRKRWGMPPSR